MFIIRWQDRFIVIGVMRRDGRGQFQGNMPRSYYEKCKTVFFVRSSFTLNQFMSPELYRYQSGKLCILKSLTSGIGVAAVPVLTFRNLASHI